jgi:hypothetical protein
MKFTLTSGTDLVGFSVARKFVNAGQRVFIANTFNVNLIELLLVFNRFKTRKNHLPYLI